jgi:hypothetical protein
MGALAHRACDGFLHHSASAEQSLPIRRFKNKPSERYHARVAVTLCWIIRRNPELVHKRGIEVSGQAPFMDNI